MQIKKKFLGKINIKFTILNNFNNIFTDIINNKNEFNYHIQIRLFSVKMINEIYVQLLLNFLKIYIQ